MINFEFSKLIRPFAHIYCREWKCPRCGIIENQVWAHGKIRILPPATSSHGTVFEVVSPPPHFITRWFCAKVADAVPEDELVAEVKEWEQKRMGVVLIGPCARFPDYEDRLYPESEVDLAALPSCRHILRMADGLVLDQQLGRRPQQGEPDQRHQQGGPDQNDVAGPG